MALPIQPTPETYSELQLAYDHFNKTLFDGELPDCLITLQRERKTLGYFAKGRFVRRTHEQTDEIALNPSYFVIRTVAQSLSTLVHEQVHLWQAHFGKPSRSGYHNREWASKMEAVGLMPTDTGKPGGKRVGQRMTHMIVSGGRFDVACAQLLTHDFTLSWVDKYPPERPSGAAKPTSTGKGFVDDKDDRDDDEFGYLDDEDDEGEDDGLGDMSGFIELPPKGGTNKSNRDKYRCSKCTAQLWGKPGMLVYCGGRTVQRGNQEISNHHETTQMMPY